MIIVTGAAGFIGSCMVRKLNDEGHVDLVLVDDFSRADKLRNLEGKKFRERIHRDRFLDWWNTGSQQVDAVFHLGARTDTTEKDTAIFDRLNLNYTKAVWDLCAQRQVPLIYASSAATYGIGDSGFSDGHDLVAQLQPLNPYGASKNDFDKWALSRDASPPDWVGLKFFNVYGPNEYHKARMASVIFHTHAQIRKTGGMKLFRSHRPEYKDGEQSRDFIYVKDVVEICYFLMTTGVPNGLYNVGTGRARTFYDLATNTFGAMGLGPKISFIDTPLDIRETYQYFTEAEMSKMRSVGYQRDFYSLEAGIEDYVRNYLVPGRTW